MRAIEAAKTNRDDRPLEDIRIVNVDVRAQLEEEEEEEGGGGKGM